MHKRRNQHYPEHKYEIEGLTQKMQTETPQLHGPTNNQETDHREYDGDTAKHKYNNTTHGTLQYCNAM